MASLLTRAMTRDERRFTVSIDNSVGHRSACGTRPLLHVLTFVFRRDL